MSKEKQPEHHEEGIDIPLDRLDPETLVSMIREFVTRDWEELGDSRHMLDDKVGQVLQQLRSGQAKVVYDLTSETWNIVVAQAPST